MHALLKCASLCLVSNIVFENKNTHRFYSDSIATEAGTFHVHPTIVNSGINVEKIQTLYYSRCQMSELFTLILCTYIKHADCCVEILLNSFFFQFT